MLCVSGFDRRLSEEKVDRMYMIYRLWKGSAITVAVPHDKDKGDGNANVGNAGNGKGKGKGK